MDAMEFESEVQRVEHRIEYRTAEYRRLGLVFVCAVVALFAGYWGGGFATSVSWSAIALAVAQLAGAAIVVVAVLRFVDVVVLRRENLAHVRYSESLARETRALLEARFPGTAERAARIDARLLLHQFQERPRDWDRPLV